MSEGKYILLLFVQDCLHQKYSKATFYPVKVCYCTYMYYNMYQSSQKLHLPLKCCVIKVCRHIKSPRIHSIEGNKRNRRESLGGPHT